METARNSTCGQGTKNAKARGEGVWGSSCAGQWGRKAGWGWAGGEGPTVRQWEPLKALHGSWNGSRVCTSFIWPKYLWQLPCTRGSPPDLTKLVWSEGKAGASLGSKEPPDRRSPVLLCWLPAPPP